MLDAYRAGQAIAKPLADQGSNNIMWHGLLAAGYGGSGQALMSQGDYAGALEEFRHDNSIQEHMAAEYPNDPRQQFALALGQETIGALLSLQGAQAGAVEAFRQSVALLRQYSGKIKNGQSELANALGGLSWHYLLAGQFAEAKSSAEEGYSLDHQKNWILINLAHAEMFLGDTDAAMELHMQHLTDVVGDKRWGEVVAGEFAALKKAGLESPTMITIEQLLTKKD